MFWKAIFFFSLWARNSGRRKKWKIQSGHKSAVKSSKLCASFHDDDVLSFDFIVRLIKYYYVCSLKPKVKIFGSLKERFRIQKRIFHSRKYKHLYIALLFILFIKYTNEILLASCLGLYMAKITVIFKTFAFFTYTNHIRNLFLIKSTFLDWSLSMSSK